MAKVGEKLAEVVPLRPDSAEAPKKKADKGRWEGGYWVRLPEGRRAYRIYKRRCKLCGTAHHTTVAYTLDEAVAYLKEWQRNGHRAPAESRQEEERRDLHFADAVEKFGEWAETQLSIQTVRTYRRGLKRWAKFLLERNVFRFSQLSRAHWQEYPAWRRATSERDAGLPSIFADQVAMRNLVKWALAGGYLETDPFPKALCPAVKVDTEKTSPRDVTFEDVKKISEAMEDDRCRTLLWCMYYWGPRGSSWWREWELFPDEKAIFWPGPSNKNDRGHRLSTKDENKFALVVQLKEQGVPNEDTWRKYFNAAKEKAKLPHLRPHDLRAGCAQRLEDEGKSLTDIMSVMQWTQFKVARRYLRRQRNLEI